MSKSPSDDGATPLGAPARGQADDYFSPAPSAPPLSTQVKRRSLPPAPKSVPDVSQEDAQSFVQDARQRLYDSNVGGGPKMPTQPELPSDETGENLPVRSVSSGKHSYRQSPPPLQPGSALPAQMARDTPLAPTITGITPTQSPGLFTPSAPAAAAAAAAAALELSQEKSPMHSPMLSPHQYQYQHQPARIADRATKDIDMMTGRKTINQYEFLGPQLGQGVHAKVKLARDMNTGEEVALKIVNRFNKKRRLGKASNPEDQIKKEVAILKKVQHPNVIRLIEVIDDPELAKVYIALEYCPRKEILWRTAGCPEVVLLEYHRIERELGHATPSAEEDERIVRSAQLRLEHPQPIRHRPRLPDRSISQPVMGSESRFWSLEFGGNSDDEDEASERRSFFGTASTVRRDSSEVLSFGTARRIWSAGGEESISPTTLRRDSEIEASEAQVDAIDFASENVEGRSISEPESPILIREYAALDQEQDGLVRSRTASVDSQLTDLMDKEVPGEFQNVPTMTISECRLAFRDVVLGLEYLHYHGIVHRDIKPMNLLRTADYRVKISDFGVSYLGKPVRLPRDSAENSDAEVEDVDEETELAKTVGTPAFYAPELCSLDHDDSHPVVTKSIDIWALGVTLYCLLFARTPFQAQNEWMLMREIAETDVYIPTKRLKAIYLSSESSPGEGSSWTDKDNSERRFPRDFVHEEIAPDLQDLLGQLLAKDPNTRITIEQIKKHPWVVDGLSNPVAWARETDPSSLSGHIIEISEKEVQAAVIPFSQVIINSIKSVSRRAGSALGFTGKTTRRRETSSAGSSEAGSSSSLPINADSKPRDWRRLSLKPEEPLSVMIGRQRSQKDLQSNKSRSSTASPEVQRRPQSIANSLSSLSSGTLADMGRRQSRPEMQDRYPSEHAASESVKTIRLSGTSRGRRESPSPPTDPSSSNRIGLSPNRGSLGAMFAGAGRSFMRTVRSRDRGSSQSQAPSRQSSTGDQFDQSPDTAFGEPTVAVSNLTAAGRMHGLDGDEPRSPAVSNSSRSSPALSRQSSLANPESSYFYRPSPPISNQEIGSMYQSLVSRNPGSATVGELKPGEALQSTRDEDRNWEYREAILSMQRRQQMEEQSQTQLNVPRSDSSRPCPPSPDDDNPPQSAQSPHEPLEYFGHGVSAGSDWNNPVSSASSETHLTSAFSPIASIPSIPSLTSANSSTVHVSESMSFQFETKDSSGGNTETAVSPPEDGTFDKADEPLPVADEGSDTDDDFVEMRSSRPRPTLSRTISSRSQKAAEHLIAVEKKTSRSGSTSTMKKIGGSNEASPGPSTGKS